jgi:biopolymer transport protein ExbB/TolQ
MSTKELLGGIADVLFLPVTGILLALVAWMLVQAGMFLRSAWVRLRGRRPACERFIAEIERTVAAGQASMLDVRLEEVIQSAEHESARALGRVRFAVRVGPSLGLMGTLIPMATALNGLARGDLPALGSNMSVAFSSTVVGIAVGVVAYGIVMVQEAWAHADIDAIRLHAERVMRAAEVAT